MILHIIRAVFVLAVLAIAIGYATTEEVLRPPVMDPGTHEDVGLSPVTKVTLVLVLPTLLAIGIILLDMGVQHKSLGGISGLFFGVVAGTILAWVLGFLVELMASVFMPTHMQAEVAAPSALLGPEMSARSGSASRPATAAGAAAVIGEERPAAGEVERLAGSVNRYMRYVAQKELESGQAKKSALVAMLKVLVGAVTIYLCVSFVMQTKDDFRFIIPYVEFAKQTKGPRPMLLDTSVVIDGRIADIAETRILEAPLIVPRFVLEEIQNIADSSDKLKRNRGRRGLDMLNRLQGSDKVEVRLLDARVAAVEELSDVDHKLVALAKHLDGQIVTNDYNLNKIAQLRGVAVININDLANALKPVVLPGETVTVKIIKPGEELGQGIGYLDDGTMVVAEQARDHIGQEMTLVVTSTLQTSAGRMIFGRPAGAEPPRGRKT